jgi:ABC-type branched-subunit amino acid transport system permease subunit
VTQFSQYVLDGLAIGAVYVLVALGFTLVFGVMGIMNVAHADLYMLAVFVMLWVGKDAGAGIGPGAIAGVMAAGLAGWLMFTLVLKRIDRAEPLALFVATLGISYFLENLVATLVSFRTRPVPALFRSSFYEVIGLRASNGQALLLGVTLAIAVGLAVWLKRSSTGKLMRAVAESPPLAEAVGIPTLRIMAIAVVIASVVAGLGGVLVSNTTLAIDPSWPTTSPSRCSPSRSSPASAASGAPPRWASPSGSSSRWPSATGDRSGRTSWAWWPWSPCCWSARRACSAPTRGSAEMGPYVQSVFVVACTYSIVTLGLWVTLSSGQFSVAHAALMGLGGYGGGIASVRFGAPFPVALVAGFVVGGLAGALFALVLRRTSGILLGTVTIALGQAVALIVRNTDALGGSQGYSGIPLRTNLGWAAGCAVVSLGAVLALRRSRVGLAMLATERDETVARSLGISAMTVRLWGFGLGGALAGLGGVLLAHNNGIIEPKELSFAAEPLFFIFLMVGGVSTPWGAFAGAIGVWWVQEELRFGSTGTFLFLDRDDRYWILGLLLVAVVLLRPRGLLVRRHLRRPPDGRGGTGTGAAAPPGEPDALVVTALAGEAAS